MSSVKNNNNRLDYAHIFDSTIEAIFIHNADSGKIIDANQAMVEMFGFSSKEEFLNGDQTVLGSGEATYSPQEAYKKLEMVKKTGQSIFEWHASRKNGELFWAEVSLRYVKKMNIIIAMVRDITQRKKLEYEKIITEENLQLLITHSRDPIFITDAAGCYRIVSQAMAEILGKSIDEIIGKTHEDLFADGRSERLKEIDQRVLEGQSVHYSDQINVKNEVIHIQVTKLPIKDSRCKINGILGIVTDISEQIKTFNQLQDAHARLEMVIREAPVGIVLSQDGVYLDANSAYLKMFRISSVEEIRGAPVITHLAPGEKEKVKQYIEKRKKGEPVPTEYETIGVKSSGEKFPLYVNVKRQELEDGPLTIAFFVDLSEKKAAKQNLLFLKTAIEQSHEGIAIADLQGKIIYANPRWASMHEREVADIIGQNLSMFHNREQLENEVIPFNELVLKKGSHEGEVGHVTASGKTFPTYMVTTLIKNKEGGPIALLGTTHDLSEQKEYQARLSISEKKLIKAQELGKMGYLEWDIKGNRFYVSEQVALLADFEKGPGWITIEEMQKFLHPEEIPMILHNIQKTIETKIPYNVEHRARKRDGSYIWVHAQAELITDENGDPDYLLGFAQDITDRKRAKEKEAHLRAELFQAQKMDSIGRLAGGVAHDFNNMLSVILGYGEMLIREIDPEHPFYKKISSIYEAGTRAQNLTRQLLAFSRKQALEIKIVSLSEVIRGFMNLIKSLFPEDILLEMELYEEPLLVEADVAQMEQVLMNLAVNARDAMPNGGTIAIKLEKISILEELPELLPGEYAKIRVIDTGKGIPKEECDKIFEPFYTTKKQGKGTGLGLSTCFGIVAQHRGRISVTSSLGKGTEFKILLPLAKEKAAMREEKKESSSAILAGTETILLLEDEPHVRNLAKSILESSGYTVLQAPNARTAIELAEQNPHIDLMLTDIVMPDMKGPEVYQQIRKKINHLKVIYMSGYSEDIIGTKGMSLTEQHFIQKPFTMNVLLSKVYRTLHAEEFGN